MKVKAKQPGRLSHADAQSEALVTLSMDPGRSFRLHWVLLHTIPDMGAQLAAEVAPTELEEVPGGQGVQAAAPWAEYVPTGQDRQAAAVVLAVFGLNVPCGSGVDKRC